MWRSPEVYLNLAERMPGRRRGEPDGDGWLNQLRVKKISRDTYQAKNVSDFASREDLIQFIWEERRRELCFEEAMRFWDMRRQGMPEVKHEFYSSMTSQRHLY